MLAEQLQLIADLVLTSVLTDVHEGKVQVTCIQPKIIVNIAVTENVLDRYVLTQFYRRCIADEVTFIIVIVRCRG